MYYNECTDPTIDTTEFWSRCVPQKISTNIGLESLQFSVILTNLPKSAVQLSNYNVEYNHGYSIIIIIFI